LTDAELQRKFTRLSEKILDKKRMEKIIQMVHALENMKEVATLAHLLVK
jgi:hypothetical protein